MHILYSITRGTDAWNLNKKLLFKLKTAQELHERTMLGII